MIDRIRSLLNGNNLTVRCIIFILTVLLCTVIGKGLGELITLIIIYPMFTLLIICCIILCYVIYQGLIDSLS